MQSIKAIYKDPSTFGGLLFKNTFIMSVSFGLCSFFTVGAEAILLLSFVLPFFYSKKAVKPFLSGFIPAVLASLIMQSLFFLSGLDIYPWLTIVVAMVLNVLPVAFLATIGSGMGTWWWKKKRRTKLNEIQNKQKAISDFKNNIKRLSIIVLFTYTTMHIGIPLIAKVYASEKQTVDSFIENYDEESTYTPGAEAIVEDPNTTNQQEDKEAKPVKLQTWKESQKQEMDALKKAELKNKEQKLSNLKKKNLSYRELQKLYKEEKITNAEMLHLVNDGVKKGKISVWDAAKFYSSEIFRTLKVAGNTIAKPFIEIGLGIGNWASNHKITAGIVVAGIVGVVAAIVFIPAVAAVASIIAVYALASLVVVGYVIAAVTGVKLVNAFVRGGEKGLREELFSKQTFQLWKNGDLFGAIGSGAADVFNVVDSLIPGMAIKKIPLLLVKAPAIIQKMGGSIKIMAEIKQVRIAITDVAGILSKDGIKTLKNVFKEAFRSNSETVTTMKMFTIRMLHNEQNVKTVENASKDIATAGKVSKSSGDAVAKKKAKEIVKEAEKREADNSTRIPKSVLKDVKKTNSSYGIKTNTNYFSEGSIQHLLDGEINKHNNIVGFHYENEDSIGKVIKGTEVYDKKGLGVYSAEIQVYGYGKKTNNGRSTFFPKGWSKEKLIEEINYGFENKKLFGGTRFDSTTKEGVKITMFVDNGKITSVYPMWPQ